MFDEGDGPPLIFVQPLQGRWQWMRPVLTALSRYARVISYSLCGNIGSGMRMDPRQGFDAFRHQLDSVFERARVETAAVCGVSYGGVIAAHYAAHDSSRVTRLIVASSPGPGWTPSSSQTAYVTRPWLTLPAFALGAVTRLGPEIAAALPRRGARAGFALRYVVTVCRFPALPHLMARRVRLLEQLDLADDCRRITAPTLVITGEPALDRVVPVESTKRYADLIRGAKYVMMEGTGHLGVLTQPERFARIVGEFVNARHS